MDFENNTNNGDNTGVVIDIQKINCYIEDQFNKMDTSMKNKIELIHPQINFYYNSFNLCIGKQGCGKTTLIIKELYKLCKSRDIDVETRKPAKYYITKLEEADEEDADDWDDEEEDDDWDE